MDEVLASYAQLKNQTHTAVRYPSVSRADKSRNTDRKTDNLHPDPTVGETEGNSPVGKTEGHNIQPTLERHSPDHKSDPNPLVGETEGNSPLSKTEGRRATALIAVVNTTTLIHLLMRLKSTSFLVRPKAATSNQLLRAIALITKLKTPTLIHLLVRLKARPDHKTEDPNPDPPVSETEDKAPLGDHPQRQNLEARNNWYKSVIKQNHLNVLHLFKKKSWKQNLVNSALCLPLTFC